MSDESQGLAAQYLSGLRHYLAGGGEAALQSAYELGRKAIADGLGGLEMLAIHQECLGVTLRNAKTPEESAQWAERAGHFFTESLSPFEMALRGFREANAKLSRNIADLQSAKEGLASQHRELLAAHQALETERHRYRDLFDFAPDGYLVTGLDGKIEEANIAAGTLLGVPSESLAGAPLTEFVVAESRRTFVARLTQLLENKSGEAQDWQFDVRTQTGASFPATLSVRAVRNPAGIPLSLRWFLRDVTERKRMEEERAQMLVREQVARAQAEAAQRFAFLAEIGTLLAASLDCETTLGNVARRVVPYLADWCLVYLAEADDKMRLLCAAHADPTMAASASRLGDEFLSISVESQTARILAKGHPDTLSTASETITGEPEPVIFLSEQGCKSVMLVPIEIHGRVLGIIVLGLGQLKHAHQEHMALAEDLARRCALAVDNAHLYRAMTAERDNAAEANRAKDEFLGILGHELRNPLVPILGWARHLKKSPAVTEDPGLRQGVEALERNALNILRLADDCLDMVRISERKVTLEKELLDLNQTVQGSIEALRQTAQEKGLQIVTELSPSSLCVLGDRTRLDQVMNNLLINAIKYTVAGSISIFSSKISDQAAIEIRDTGIGIAPEFLEQVFQPFRRGSKGWLASDAGLGLGLAIARKIVELHGGTIWAESPGLGRGSTFHVRLGLAPAEVSQPSSSLPASSEESQAGSLCVLLIDDHKDITALMKMDLEALGYTVHTAADGPQGIETATRESPDVIVSDIKMPRMDGYELIRRLRRIPSLASVPFIALTGFGMKKDVEAALAAGYDAHLNKPAEVNELSDLIQKLAARRRTLSSKS